MPFAELLALSAKHLSTFEHFVCPLDPSPACFTAQGVSYLDLALVHGKKNLVPNPSTSKIHIVGF